MTLIDDVHSKFLPSKYDKSFVEHDGAVFWLDNNRQLAIVADSNHSALGAFDGTSESFDGQHQLLRCQLSHDNAYALQNILPWLKPKPLGLTTSAGFGDRLGLATPGHVRALQQTLEQHPQANIAPIYAQQSIREMQRTARTPQDVMADATWGTFEAGWQQPVGSDADHQKNTTDIDSCVTAGFTFFTIDPGDHVDSEAEQVDKATLEQKLNALPWETLDSSPDDLINRYDGFTVELDNGKITLDKQSAAVAAAKYGGAVAHVVNMYRHLQAKGVAFELEVSVDETETPTSHAEHVYIANELKRLGVEWVSLAPRFVGRFEKGVDYIGNTDELKADLEGHAAIARVLGPYKLSLHSGSDKFSVYPLIVEATKGVVHLKTAGTSYLEALRVIAQVKPDFFREIVDFGIERYPTDRATYHVSAELEKVPEIQHMADTELTSMLDHFDARQVLHVTFGSALDTFGDAIKTILKGNEELHYQMLEKHFLRHLEPFAY